MPRAPTIKGLGAVGSAAKGLKIRLQLSCQRSDSHVELHTWHRLLQAVAMQFNHHSHHVWAAYCCHGPEVALTMRGDEQGCVAVWTHLAMCMNSYAELENPPQTLVLKTLSACDAQLNIVPPTCILAHVRNQLFSAGPLTLEKPFVPRFFKVQRICPKPQC